MNVLTLLRDLESRGIHLEVRGGRLRYEAPSGVLTSDLLEELRAKKHDLIALLAAEEPPAFEEERTFAAAWRGAVRELGEIAGHPRLSYKPGHTVAPGATNWGRFIARASVPQLQLVTAAARRYLAATPGPESGSRRSSQGNHDFIIDPPR